MANKIKTGTNRTKLTDVISDFKFRTSMFYNEAIIFLTFINRQSTKFKNN